MSLIMHHGILSTLKVTAPAMADNTIMFRFSDSSYDPSSLTTLTGATWTQVSSSPNVWLWDGSSVVETDWSNAFGSKWTSYGTNNVEIIDAGILTTPTSLGSGNRPYPGMFKGNTGLVSVACTLSFPNAINGSRIFNTCRNISGSVTLNLPSATDIGDLFGGNNSTSNVGITAVSITTSNALANANQVFRGCTALQSFSISNTAYVSNFGYLCNNCTALKYVPLLATDSVTNVSYMFQACRSVEGGALALYTQMSTQTHPPTTISSCFKYCGSNTTTGAAELAQIPTTWGGTMAV